MIARNAAIYKWTLYSLAAILFMALQGMFFHRVHLWGVIPFLYPLLAAIPATYEQPFPATAFALALGVVCDLLLPERFPCFYTLTFPLTGLIASLFSRNLLPAGVLCSYAVSAIAFAFGGAFHCFLLWAGGTASIWKMGMFLTLREFVITTPLLALPVTGLFALLSHATRDGEIRNG